MVFSGIVILIVLVLFNPIQISVGLIWIAQIFPMSFTISLGGINFRIIDIYMVIVILTWITLYILPSDKIKIIFGWSEFFATLFMIVFVINIFRGLAFHYNQGTSAPTFRSDLVRGPIYYGTLFFFNKIIELKDNIKIILIKHWFYAAIASSIIYFIMAIIKIYLGLSYSMWGFNIQLFVFVWGFSFTMGIFVNKRWWILSLLYFFLLFYIASRTTLGGIFLIYFFIIIFWIIALPKGKKLKTITKIAAYSIGSFATVFILFFLFFSSTQSTQAYSIISRNTVLLKPQYLQFLPSLQWRFLESLESIHFWKNSSLLFGTGWGKGFGTTMNSLGAVDVLYMTVLAKAGLLGLISFLGMFAAFFINILKLIKNFNLIESNFVKAFVINCAAIIPTALIMGLTMSHLWFGSATIITMVVFMAISSKLWREIKQKKVPALELHEIQ
ncbi:hypothetical protein J7L68_00440 [bacterium]|nr:hypothetical protein [bacterium]